ncbi:MAG: VanZ family protein [Bacteroidales bacterium]
MIGKFKKSIFWFLVIIALTLIPVSNTPGLGLLPGWFDKVVHAALFAVLSVLLISDIVKERKLSFVTKRIMVIVFTTGIIIAVSTELIQHFFIPGRTGSIFDFISDVVGLVAGYVFYRVIRIK